MGGKRMLWGDVNAALNRLVAEGAIVAFKSNFDRLIPDLGLHVHVTPVRPVTDLEAKALCNRVESALAFVGPVTVTVDQA